MASRIFKLDNQLKRQCNRLQFSGNPQMLQKQHGFFRLPIGFIARKAFVYKVCNETSTSPWVTHVVQGRLGKTKLLMLVRPPSAIVSKQEASR